MTNQITSIKVFNKISNNIILFRLVSGSGVVPYNYFVTPNNIMQSIFDINVNNLQNFRNILLDEWNNIRPIAINITMKNNNGEIIAGLLFNVKSSDTLASWFNFQNLNSSFPWNKDSILNQIFNFKGDDISRTFFIYNPQSGCTNDLGVLCVFFATDRCPFGNIYLNETQNSYPIISIVNNMGKPDLWTTYQQFVRSMEMTGIYDLNTIIYG